MPVFPDVASTIVRPGLSAPDASPSSNHPGGRAILHRPARILPLRLRVQLDAGRFALEAPQADERRPADEIQNGRRGLRIGPKARSQRLIRAGFDIDEGAGTEDMTDMRPKKSEL